ncbi:alpha/beta hydrolase family protein [Aquimarina sp. 2304DJ70-9]|uniref:alpha/beta hydrolase family protein n=1 Tax=Aquimarina penaris TaxID=3231044 RepID=UPI003461FD04
MKKVLLLAIFLVLFFSCASSKKEQQFAIGQKSVTYTDVSRNRSLVTEIWYPTYDTVAQKETSPKRKELFKSIPTVPNASIPDKKFPLLLISHGTGGNRFSLTWFIEKMVQEGYIVVSVDHYGNSTFNKLPREFVKWWERAIDIQYVLTHVLKDEQLGSRIDTSRIGGVGFSLGGYTNIALAGGYVDRNNNDQTDRDREMPPEFPKTDEHIDFDTDSLIVASYNTYKDQVKDKRIKAFFVMAPAIGFGFHSEKQTETITAPIYIVAGKGDTNTPIQYNAQQYHRLIKSSTLHLFDEHVNHYVFLNEATAFGKEVAPTITIDHPNVNRGEIHQKTVDLAIDFFNQHL